MRCTPMQIGQTQLLARDPHEDAILMSRETWSHGETRNKM